MVADVDTEYLTVTEAASLLHVGEAAIRRWIDIGMLPSHRIGQRQVAVARDDLTEFLRRARPPSSSVSGKFIPPDNPVSRRLTPEEVEYGLAVMDEAERLSKDLMNRLGIEKFEPESWVLLDEARDERAKQLG